LCDIDLHWRFLHKLLIASAMRTLRSSLNVSIPGVSASGAACNYLTSRARAAPLVHAAARQEVTLLKISLWHVKHGAARAAARSRELARIRPVHSAPPLSSGSTGLCSQRACNRPHSHGGRTSAVQRRGQHERRPHHKRSSASISTLLHPTTLAHAGTLHAHRALRGAVSEVGPQHR